MSLRISPALYEHLKRVSSKEIEVSIDNQLFWGVAVGANGNSPSKNKAFRTASYSLPIP